VAELPLVLVAAKVPFMSEILWVLALITVLVMSELGPMVALLTLVLLLLPALSLGPILGELVTVVLI
jgi:hypothetical protein